MQALLEKYKEKNTINLNQHDKELQSLEEKYLDLQQKYS